MIVVHQLKKFIIKPVLIDLSMFSDDATQLMVFTAAAESAGGTYLKRTDLSFGLYGMDSETYIHLWEGFLKTKHNTYLKLISHFNMTRMPPEDSMIYDMRYATAMARIYYSQFPLKIPDALDVEGLWDHYNYYYNKKPKVITKEKALADYQSLISG